MHRYLTTSINYDLKQRDDLARLDVRTIPNPRSQHERKNPSRRLELKKHGDAFKESERAMRNRGTVEPGVFAVRTSGKRSAWYTAVHETLDRFEAKKVIYIMDPVQVELIGQSGIPW